MRKYIFYNLELDKKLEIEEINLYEAYRQACKEIPKSDRDKWAIGTN